MQRKFMFPLAIVLLLITAAAGGAWGWKKYRANVVNHLSVPDDLVVDVIATGITDARQMALSADGKTLFVGSRRAGKVYRIHLGDDGKALSTDVLMEDLPMPSGVALRNRNGNEELYVAAIPSVWVIADPARSADARLLTDKLPDARHHGWKYLRFGPDGFLYIPVGAPCNVCASDDPRFASILRMDPDSGQTELFAAGIRNSVGMDFHPDSGALWFSENGRDMLGDDVPEEEINIAAVAGLHFGFPYIHQGDLPDPEFGKDIDARKFEAPYFRLPAHVAPLGITFNRSTGLGAEWQGALFIAEHGSWNRSTMVGYRVTVLRFAGDGKPEYEPFLSGFLSGKRVLGRPADVLFNHEGHLLVADDLRGRIFRIRSGAQG